jgi:hypothetical protein
MHHDHLYNMEADREIYWSKRSIQSWWGGADHHALSRGKGHRRLEVGEEHHAMRVVGVEEAGGDRRCRARCSRSGSGSTRRSPWWPPAAWSLIRRCRAPGRAIRNFKNDIILVEQFLHPWWCIVVLVQPLPAISSIFWENHYGSDMKIV